tara:strand:+ start:222 stop:1100 length:879 start_codon:yes stop_codon:yes gene_type:complete
MKILFIGNVELSNAILKTLITLKCDIIGVVTTKGSRYNSDFVDLSEICHLNDIPIHYTIRVNSIKTYKWIKKKSPDYIFCFGWSQILNSKILKIPKESTIGYHPSKLPEFRGRHPIIWSIILNLKETASTFFLINEKIDDGPIINQKKITISRNEDSRSLYLKIINVSKKQIREIINQIYKNKLKVVRQSKNKKTLLRKRNIEDGKIDWRMNAESISRLVRALNKPYPGAYFTYKNKIFNVWKLKVIKNKKKIEPGKILSINDGYIDIKCEDAAIRLVSFTPNYLFKENTYL